MYDAFTFLKKSLKTPPLFELPDFSKPFIFETCASSKEVVAVLSQKK